MVDRLCRRLPDVLRDQEFWTNGIISRGHVEDLRVRVVQITRIRLNDDLTSGTAVKVITSELSQVPTTAARFGSLFAVVNAKFDTGFPPTADQYEVALVGA